MTLTCPSDLHQRPISDRSHTQVMALQFSYQEAFDDLINLAEENGYIHAQYMDLQKLFGAFQRLIDGSARDGTSLTEATAETIDLLVPALIMVDETQKEDFDLTVQEILDRYGYPNNEDDNVVYDGQMTEE